MTALRRSLVFWLTVVSIFGFSLPALAQTASREDLEAELKKIEEQIAEYEKQLATTAAEKKTLAGKIQQLKTEQSKLKLQIQATAKEITVLGKQLTITEQKIQGTLADQLRVKGELSRLLRLLNQADGEIVIAALANKGGLSETYVQVQNYTRLFDLLADVVKKAKELEAALRGQKISYAEQQDEARELLSIKQLQQKELAGSLSEQSTLLKETSGREATYAAMVADSKKRAATIRSRIYELFGTTKQINFGEALAIATWVSDRVGTRPAFLLAILTQESNLGRNVGTCNRAGDPEEKGWRVIMKPERDHDPFLKITSDLGLDPDTTPVSCPMKDSKGKQVGWGGAMGPAQFIPSTWMGYRDKVTAITGQTANPWDIRDAFVAAGVKLKRDGADGGRDGEWAAAMRYFSGSTNTKYRFYGDNVLKLADKYQTDIDDLAKAEASGAKAP